MAAPLLLQSLPLDNATGVSVTANLGLGFDQAVKAGSGFIRIYKADGTLFHTISVTDASQVIFSATQPARVVINPNVDLVAGTGYYILVDAGAIENLGGEGYAGISSSTALNFTTAGSPPGDTVAPLLNTTTPADNATGVAVGTNLVLTFNEAVKAGSGNIEIRKVSDGTIVKTIAITDTTQATFSGNQLTINPTTDLAAGTGYYVTFASGVVRDLANNNFVGISSSTALNFTTASAPGDTTAPTLQTSAPADNATNVIPSTNIVLTFDEVVKAGSGNIEIRKVSDDTLAKSISITDGTQVTFSGSQVTINPTTNLDAETAYYVKLASGVILDLANNPFTGISSPTVLNFTTRETTPPSLVSTVPTNDALNVDVGANIVLTFNEAVKAGTFGDIEIHYNTGWLVQTIAITDASQISFSGNQLTINPSNDLLEDQGYYITIDSGAVRDLVNNAFPGIASGNFYFFTTDPNAPLLVDTIPDDDATLVSAGATLQLWFDEQVVAGSGNIEIRNSSNGTIAYSIAVTDTSQVSFDSYGMTIDPSSDFSFGGGYYVTFGSGVVLDRVGNPFAGISSPTTFNFTVEPTDLTAPRMTGSTPVDNATGVDIGADLIASFNESVKAGTGSIYINYSTGGHARVIDVNDTSQITFSGNQLIIDPTSDLLEGFLYRVSWDPNAVTDVAGNAFGSESYPSGFWFTTADPTPPQLASTTPIDNATDVWVGTNLRLAFNEPIKAGSGNIEIHDALDGSVVQTFAINSSQVYVDGYEVQINPNDFVPAKTYYVTLASGVVLDMAGNPFAGITSPSTFNFSTPSDVIFGTPDKETVTGGDKNEIINGLAGWDILAGNRGDDRYVVQNYERDETLLLLAEDPNLVFNDLDGSLFSFAGNSQVSFELVDVNHDGLIDQLYAHFTDDDASASVIFTTDRSGTNLVPGIYLNAQEPFTTGTTAPGLYFVIGSTVPGELSGSFEIVAIEIDYSGATPVVVRASITFDVDAGGGFAHMAGVFNYNYAPGGPFSYDAVVESPNQGTDTVEAWIDYVLPANVENLTLGGGREIDGWGNELANLIIGNNRNNLLDGAAGNDSLEGGFGDDTFNIVAGAGNDVIVDFQPGIYGDVVNLDGFALNTFSAVQAAMTQNGSNTILNLGNGQTLTFLDVAPSEFEANDFAFLDLPAPPSPPPPPPSGPQPFTLPVSGAYTNTISGTRRVDNLQGTSANNRLDGKQGNDTMTGLAGDDTYLVDTSGDNVVETDGNGIDTVISSASSYTLANNVENLTLTGTNTHTATGNGLNNLIIASSRPDTINGGAGTDIIQAGTGACILTGGIGNDIFAFPVAGSLKTITDFTVGEDLVDLRTLLTWYGGSNPVGDGVISVTATAGGVLVSVKATAGGSLQSLVKLTGISVGDVDVGGDILWDA